MGFFNKVDFVEKPHTTRKLLPLLHRAVDLEAELHQKATRCEFLQSLWDSLTPQQRKVAVLVAEGNSNSTIAAMLGITERMVEVHRSKAYEKLGVDKPAELATTIAAMKACGIDVEP